MSGLFDLAEVIRVAYNTSSNRGQFLEAINGDGRMGGQDGEMLFRLCNLMWRDGFEDGKYAPEDEI